MPTYRVDITVKLTTEADGSDEAHSMFMGYLRDYFKTGGVPVGVDFEVYAPRVTLLDEPEPDCDDEIDASQVEDLE